MAKSDLCLAVLVASIAACGADELSSASSLDPPATDGYDPSDGMASGNSYSSSVGSADGTADGPDGGTDDGPSECEDANKRCPHAFTFADESYESVELFGDFASDGWTAGVPMQLDRATWHATVPVPYDAEVQYKFRLDGATWATDPDNPDTVSDGQGGENSVLAPVTCDDWSCEPDVMGLFDWRDAVIYFVFVDRFENGDPGNDDEIAVPMASNWQGGDWAGVTAKIEQGYFTDLGVNVLWLSVPMDNTNASGIGTDAMDYSAYHGYWPTDLAATEEHFGTLAELQQLVETAHANDLKVLFDYAMNHVHDSSPVFADNPAWFWPNDNGSGGNCVCGSGCSWDGAQGKRCWFTPYLPDFDFTNPDARDFSIGNAVRWIQDTGVDGYRLDAVKHIEDEWLLELRERVSTDIESRTGEHFYMVGETFTGDKPTIAHYVNPDMLDGQFDFPLRMQMAYNVLMRAGAMSDLAAFMDDNDGYYGAAVMSTFIGNHDIPRAIHLAQDTPLWDNQWADGKDRAWTNQPGLPGGGAAFERLGNAFTILMTTAGAPLVYYGDEVGMPGAGDPDNRRFMQWDGYSAGQQALYDHLKRLIAIRKDHQATRRGARTTLSADDDTMVYSVEYGGDALWVAFNRGDVARDVGGLPAEPLVDELTGAAVEGPSATVPPRSALVLARQ